jgi:hypothetical protein
MKKILAFIPILILVTAVFAIPNKEPIDSVTLIHYKDGRVKVGGGSCSKLLGVKWTNLPVSYVINPDGYNEAFVTNAISTSANTWDSATSKQLFDGYTKDYNVAWGIRDDKNVYVFGRYSNDNVIAVTTYWYTRNSKQLVEYDVLFNTYYNWKDCSIGCDTSPSSKDMDLETIALHETGHGLGSADVYSQACSYVVMYGYGSPGEIKRALTQSDVNGIWKLYGQ